VGSTAFQMPAHRHASTAPGIRRPPRPSAWSLRAPRWASTGRPPTTAGSPPRNGGARPVSPPEPLPTGARLPVSVPACRWTVISNAFREPAGKNCVAKCATHFSLIGGKYRPLPRKEGVALVQAITILPPKGVSPLLARQRDSDTLRVGAHGDGASKRRSDRRLLLQPDPGGVRFALAIPPDRALSPSPPSHGGSYVTPTPWLKCAGS